MGFIKEFKEFVTKGSVVDMAVGVIVGGAFSKLTAALVSTLINPLIGMFIGSMDLSNMVLKVGNATFKYGSFINAVIEFLIIMFVIFMIVKTINKLRAMKATEEKTETAPTTDDYLKEIRDLLKENNK